MNLLRRHKVYKCRVKCGDFTRRKSLLRRTINKRVRILMLMWILTFKVEENIIFLKCVAKG